MKKVIGRSPFIAPALPLKDLVITVFSRSLLLLLFLAGFLSCGSPSVASFHLQSSEDLPAGTPITLELPDDLTCCAGIALQTKDHNEVLPLQSTEEDKAVFLLETPLAANTSRIYTVQPGATELKAGPSLRETGTGIDISHADQPILTYNTATLSPQAGLPDYYKRSGFIHPFYSPGGKVLTDGFPVGHTHQHGIFFAWVNTTYRGDFTDFWNQQKETGTVAFRELASTTSGPNFAGFQARHEHLSLQHGPVLDEQWLVEAYHLPGFHVLDLTTRQKVMGTDTLFINKYHYGGMGIRLSAAWNEVDSSRYTGPMQVITSEGITDRDSANHTRPNWTAVYGQLDGSPAGVALFDHPSNFRFPQPVRVHPSMPYFVLTPMLDAAFEQVPGEEYTYTFRILSFDGKPDPAKLDAMWRAYAAKVEVVWEKE